MPPDFDFSAPGKWCRQCWVCFLDPIPSRSNSHRIFLGAKTGSNTSLYSLQQMCFEDGYVVDHLVNPSTLTSVSDHHCPWVGAKCIVGAFSFCDSVPTHVRAQGHRTYPAFLHFLFCITLLATYIAIMCIFALVYAFNNPYVVVSPHIDVLQSWKLNLHRVCRTKPRPFMNYYSPSQAWCFASLSAHFSFTIYTLSRQSFPLLRTAHPTNNPNRTNQTTLENLSPFLLLRHLPPLPSTGHSLSDPPLEPELSYPQRRLVKDAHGHIRLYDVGWRQNWTQVFGWNHTYGWVARILSGGAM